MNTIINGIDAADTTWMLISTAMVMMMTPALGMFEAGLLRFKNSLSVIVQTFFGLAILSALWFIVGFSLTFSSLSSQPQTDGAAVNGEIIGGLNWIFFHNISINEPLSYYAPTIPSITFASFEMMFAVITPLLITGAFAERIKWSAFVLFIILWSLFIYYPLAHWVWSKDGWLAKLGVFDFAGGIVIHTSAGFGSLASAIVLGRRMNFSPNIQVPHSIPLAAVGALLLWFGWFGFNAGSAFATGVVASNAFFVTHIASATSAIVWGLLSWIRAGKTSTTGVITGAIAGLAGVTPASGYLDGQSALLLGIVVGLASYYAANTFKWRVKIDDALDVGAVHGISGVLGSLLIGVLASTAINPHGPNGAISGNLIQLPIQAVGVGVSAALGFFGTAIIMILIDRLIGLRVTQQQEESGLDLSEHSERAYME